MWSQATRMYTVWETSWMSCSSLLLKTLRLTIFHASMHLTSLVRLPRSKELPTLLICLDVCIGRRMKIEVGNLFIYLANVLYLLMCQGLRVELIRHLRLFSTWRGLHSGRPKDCLLKWKVHQVLEGDSNDLPKGTKSTRAQDACMSDMLKTSFLSSSSGNMSDLLKTSFLLSSSTYMPDLLKTSFLLSSSSRKMKPLDCFKKVWFLPRRIFGVHLSLHPFLISLKSSRRRLMSLLIYF